VVQSKTTKQDPKSNIKKLNYEVLGGIWPGIQLYYPPIKYSPSMGIYEELDAASKRMKKHAHTTEAHTLVFDLEDGCRQKDLSRKLLENELPALRDARPDITIAIRVNSFRTEEYMKDMKLIKKLPECIDVVMLSKAGEVYGSAEIRDLSNELDRLNQSITIQPIIEHPKSLKISPDLMAFPTVGMLFLVSMIFQKRWELILLPLAG